MNRRIVEDFEYIGYRCQIVEIDLSIPDIQLPIESRYYCGYTFVPKEHPDFGNDTLNLDVHGGITYSQDAEGKIGFDCGHYEDTQITCNIEYVRGQIVSMVHQLNARWDNKTESNEY